uniref:Thymidine kinase n=1 Tax=Abalone asfa-like virus TaxID=2839893 RepID=A0A5K7Y3F4_9VIRU|nr:thymidine kinase homolog protein [Abalone asfa-like virus]BCY04542.1 Thymidine kinase [Abalone asfa-like virus]
MDRCLQDNLTLLIGPMFASKTSWLLHQAQLANQSNINYIFVKHIFENRNLETPEPYTHNHVTYKSFKVNMVETQTLKDIIDVLLTFDMIFIDEGQFFSDLVEIVTLLANKGKNIAVAGLSSDFRQLPFENINNLIPYCDNIIHMRSVCVYCKNSAIFSIRKTKDERLFVVGDSDIYIVVCRKCLQKDQLKK